MEFINETERIACARLRELTAGQAGIFCRKFSDSPLSALTVLYDGKDDILILNRDHQMHEAVRNAVLAYMDLPEDEREELRHREDMPDLYREIYEVIDGMILGRRTKREIFILQRQRGNILPESMKRAICSQCGHDGYFAMCYAYQYGIIQGKRAERARRKRGAGA